MLSTDDREVYLWLSVADRSFSASVGTSVHPGGGMNISHVATILTGGPDWLTVP